MYRYVGSGILHTHRQKVVNIPTLVHEFSSQTIHFFKLENVNSTSARCSVPNNPTTETDSTPAPNSELSQSLPIQHHLTSPTSPSTSGAADVDHLSDADSDATDYYVDSPDSNWYNFESEGENPSAVVSNSTQTDHTDPCTESDSDDESEVIPIYTHPVLRCTLCRLIGEHDRIIDHIFSDHILPFEGEICPHCDFQTSHGLESHILSKHLLLQRLQCYNNESGCKKSFIRHQSRIIHMKSCTYAPPQS